MPQFKLFLALAALTATGTALAETTASAQTAAAAATPAVGKMLYSTGGKKLAAVYKVDAAGAAQILLEGRLVTVPAATLTTTDGRIETSLTRKDLLTAR